MLYSWRKVSIFVLLALTLFLLSGCAKGSAHVTVNRNGSIDTAVNLRLDSRTQSMVSGKMDDLITRLQKVGIPLRKSQDGSSTKYQYLKTYASFQELRSMMSHSNSDLVDANVETTDRWLYTRYTVETQLHLSSYSDKILQNIDSSTLSKPLVRLLLQGFAFDFSLTLPFDVFGDNNAAVQDGRTLTWHIKMIDSEPIRMVIYVPNFRNIGIAVGVFVLFTAVTVIIGLRRRRLRKS
ncbi:DUF3153 domain-containing protein [Paenibacillus wynnii]|uniref:DUF3153 domain-containing protein n=1 Tax=Paenibacillus wynnii TaxID=268407 RepID=UPI00068E2EFE|nr:DUF3153 domain-containing protein [Paenibacillus wynnii]